MFKYKLIIFDLDGVLINTKDIHYHCLNQALEEVDPLYKISFSDHLSKFDGLKTEQKLVKLSSERGLSQELHLQIWNKKQQLTNLALQDIVPCKNLISFFKELSNLNVKIVCCSNSIRKTVITILTKLGIIEYFDLFISNEDVANSKPHAEMYWKAMSTFKANPEETLIVEDSPTGLLAAQRSGAEILRIKSPEDLIFNNFLNRLTIRKINMNTKWQDDKLNVVIPMAGAGSRFEKAGYTFPKPLIEVNGKPMIQVIVENLNLDAHYIFIVQKHHREKYNLDSLLNIIAPGCDILETEGITEGAACTVLLAKHLIDNNQPLIMANSDQYVDWNSSEFMYKMQEQDVDAGILTFESTHPKWSFAKLNDLGYVTEVAEKNPISNTATVGIYYWKHGSNFVRYAEQMIEKNIRVNNEFYVCPVFNQAIEDGKKIKTFDAKKMWGIGTPEDLNVFLTEHK